MPDIEEGRLSIRKRSEPPSPDDEMIDLFQFQARTEQRLDDHDDEIERSRSAREEYIPRFQNMEKVVLELTNTVVPKLTNAIDAMTTELVAQRTYRAVMVKIFSWGLATATAIAIAVISAKLGA